METGRWTDPTQPQTLQMAVILSYFNAVFGLLLLLAFGALGLLGLLQGLAAYAVANGRRWGYRGAVVLAVLGVFQVGYIFGAGAGFSLGSILQAAFAVALVALLLHRDSREYQRLWFR